MTKNLVSNAIADLHGRDIIKLFDAKKYRNAIIIMKNNLGLKLKARKKIFKAYQKLTNTTKAV